MYGYRYGEVELPTLPEVEENARILRTLARVDLTRRPAAQISMGCHVKGIAQPHPDTGDPRTIEAGVRKRFILRPPQPDRRRLSELTHFVRRWCQVNLTPLSPDSDVSVETWLSKTNYPQARRDELLAAWNADDGILLPRDYLVKSFIKDETYEEYKHARIINSRTDKFKCAVGPTFRLIEEQVFKHPAFIKKVPVADRPEFIKTRLVREGARYFWADFTSFESHFTAEIMESIEFVMYAYMVKFLENGRQFMNLLRTVIAGLNKCVLKYLVVFVAARRMSGEMNTSLGNGFTNLMLLLFLFNGCGEHVDPVVEGDDSNTSYMFRCPTVADFASLGFTIKCGSEDNFEEMSFCGMVFDPSDLVNITNPMKVLATFGLARSAYCRYSQKKLMLLLRCKSLSFLHQYPGCPIIQSLANYGLRMTKSYDVRHFVYNDRNLGFWERAEYIAALDAYKLPLREVPINTRKLMERLFAVTVDQQISVERYLDSLSELRPLDLDQFSIPFPDVYRHYFDNYSMSVGRLDPDLDHPHEYWAQLKDFVPEF